MNWTRKQEFSVYEGISKDYEYYNVSSPGLGVVGHVHGFNISPRGIFTRWFIYDLFWVSDEVVLDAVEKLRRNSHATTTADQSPVDRR